MREKFGGALRSERDIILEEGVIVNSKGKLAHNKDYPVKYFAVLCKGGHIAGNKKFIPLLLGVRAYNAKAASQIARFVGRVKHDRKDAVILTVETTKEQYEQISTINNNDPYMNIHDIKAQKEISKQIEHRVMREPDAEDGSLTAETESYGPGHSLQNFIIGRVPFSKKAGKILVESYIEENQELLTMQTAPKREEPYIVPGFEEEVKAALRAYEEEKQPQSTPKATQITQKTPKTQDDGQGQ